jgi:hypothetical protein
MRLICVSLLSVLILTGCASRKHDKSDAEVKSPRKVETKAADRTRPTTPAKVAVSQTVTNNNQIITLAEQQTGKVHTVNQVSRFVILDFGLNPLPPLDQRLNVYRSGVKIGELKVTGPVMNNHIAADILTGDVRPDDLVRRD